MSEYEITLVFRGHYDNLDEALLDGDLAAQATESALIYAVVDATATEINP